jgi:hypothetical protein
MHTAEILYLMLAILFAIIMFQAVLGLLPRARRRVWSFWATGYKDVAKSRFGLVSTI